MPAQRIDPIERKGGAGPCCVGSGGSSPSRMSGTAANPGDSKQHAATSHISIIAGLTLASLHVTVRLR